VNCLSLWVLPSSSPASPPVPRPSYATNPRSMTPTGVPVGLGAESGVSAEEVEAVMKPRLNLPRWGECLKPCNQASIGSDRSVLYIPGKCRLRRCRSRCYPRSRSASAPSATLPSDMRGGTWVFCRFDAGNEEEANQRSGSRRSSESGEGSGKVGKPLLCSRHTAFEIST
jgi:hypothetical protein